ncbi:MAG: HAD family phosphatase [Spirochaetales bacterium]|nr:HAD family phosphatase [Candidatus Physcosoma equi]
MDKTYAIFDIDGTLLDSMPYWKQLDLEFFHRHGLHDVPPSIRERTVALTMEESARVFIDELGMEGTPESIAEEFFTLMAEHYVKDVKVKEGVLEYLEKLKRKGVQMCAASATPTFLLLPVLQRLGVAPYLSFVLCCDDVGEGKHSPKVYLEAMKRMGGTLGETAVYEDSHRALTTAKNAGFYSIAVYDEDSRPYWEEMTRMADEVIFDWRDQ